MVEVPPDRLAEQQRKIRQAIKDLEEQVQLLPTEQRKSVERTIRRLTETLRGDEEIVGKRT
jgi:predicted ATP-grasp superfamily ATP-dependent carboligase